MGDILRRCERAWLEGVDWGERRGEGERGGSFTRKLKTDPRGLRIGGMLSLTRISRGCECGFIDSGVIEIRFSTRIRTDDASHRAF